MSPARNPGISSAGMPSPRGPRPRRGTRGPRAAGPARPASAPRRAGGPTSGGARPADRRERRDRARRRRGSRVTAGRLPRRPDRHKVRAMPMDLAPSDRAAALRDDLLAFMDSHVYPAEADLRAPDRGGRRSPPPAAGRRGAQGRGAQARAVEPVPAGRALGRRAVQPRLRAPRGGHGPQPGHRARGAQLRRAGHRATWRCWRCSAPRSSRSAGSCRCSRARSARASR